MKQLGVYLTLSVMLIFLFGVFMIPIKVSAQAVDLNSYTKDAAISVLQAQIDYLILEQTDEASVKFASMYGGINDQRFKDYVVENKNLIAKLEEGKQVLSEEYDRVSSDGSNPAIAYNASLTRVNNVEFLIGPNASGLSKIPQINVDTARITTAIRLAATDNIDKLKYSQSNLDQTIGNGIQSATQRATASAPTIKGATECTGTSWTIIGCVNSIFTWVVKTILLEFVGFFLWASANLLNFAMLHGIFMFKNFAPDGASGIYPIWLVIRQIVSVFILLAGFFVGFMAIIGKSENESLKKYVVFLVVFGLFVNFSYPIVRMFIDVSNVVSLQIYQTTFGPNILSDNQNDSAGSRIMAKMGLQELVMSATSVSSGSAETNFTSKITSLPGALAAVGFVGYSAYIFFMAAFLIIFRTAILVCIIIASPILLVDTVVPALGEKAKWLRGIFISQLFVAPVFTIMLALTLKFLDIFNLNTGSTSTSATLNSAASGTNQTIVVFFNLIMMLIMLHIMLKVTKSVSGQVGEMVTNWAGKGGSLGVGMALGLGTGSLGFLGRQTLGRAGESLAKQGGIAGDLGRAMSSSKYDLRNLKSTQWVSSKFGVSLGKGVDKNRQQIEEEKNRNNMNTAGSISDAAERAIFLERKFGKDSKEIKSFEKTNDDILAKYANASEFERNEMTNDAKNKHLIESFNQINSGNLEGMSEKIKKTFADKVVKDRVAKSRNEQSLAEYLTSNQSARDSLYKNAIAANDIDMIKQIEELNLAVTKQPGSLTEADLTTFKDGDMIAKILQNDKNRLSTVTEAKAKMEAQEAIERARTSAMESQASAAKATNQKLEELAKSNNDLTQALKEFVRV